MKNPRMSVTLTPKLVKALEKAAKKFSKEAGKKVSKAGYAKLILEAAL
jgi:ribosomal protein L18E